MEDVSTCLARFLGFHSRVRLEVSEWVTMLKGCLCCAILIPAGGTLALDMQQDLWVL